VIDVGAGAGRITEFGKTNRRSIDYGSQVEGMVLARRWILVYQSQVDQVCVEAGGSRCHPGGNLGHFKP
jgi:hypothetical protein